MARKTTTFPIEGRDEQVELKELTVREIMNLLQGDNTGQTLGDFKQLVTSFLPKCSNLEINDFYDMPPSDIELIWTKFKEVNSVFLKVSQQMGMEKLLGDFKVVILEAITEDFSKLLVDSLKKDMSELSTTDTPSS